jgi:hypothetical protein
MPTWTLVLQSATPPYPDTDEAFRFIADKLELDLLSGVGPWRIEVFKDETPITFRSSFYQES